MPLIFAILLQNFVHGRIFINAISSTVNPDFAAGDDHEDEFCSFFSQITQIKYVNPFRRRQLLVSVLQTIAIAIANVVSQTTATLLPI